MQDIEQTNDPATIKRISYNNKEIIIIATAHVSKESKEEVKRVIEEEQPNSVCIELDENRYKSIIDKEKHSNMDIVQVIKEGKTMLVLANLFLSSFQRKIAAKMDIQPGAEMIQGIDSANEAGAEIVLADRDIQTTFKRIWRKSTLGEKFKLLYQILGSLLTSESELETEDIEKMKSSDMLDSALSVMGETFPLIKEVLIDERDICLANNIKNAPGDKVVAVLGAGHVPGVVRWITKEPYSIPQEIDSNLYEKKITRKMIPSDKEYLNDYYKKEDEDSTNYTLEKELNHEEDDKLLDIMYKKLPKPGLTGKIIGWAVPVLIVAWIVSGFFYGRGIENFLSYVLGTGIGAALGAVISLAHPLTILIGIVGAPITVLHPILGIGMFTGLSEAFFRKPRVSDLENIGKDIQSVKGFFKNRFTHILLVVLFSSIGTMLGIFVGIPLFTSIFNF